MANFKCTIYGMPIPKVSDDNYYGPNNVPTTSRKVLMVYKPNDVKKRMEKELKLNQHRDNIKNEYCKNNRITLLRVNNLKAVDELIEYFKLMNLTF